jgi:hypothetical protein
MDIRRPDDLEWTRDRLLDGANWRASRASWLALRLPCARCGLPIDYDTDRYLKRANGTKIVNPWSLAVGHVIGRDQAKQLGWSDDKINSRANTQPEPVRCSASSGGRYVQNKDRQLRSTPPTQPAQVSAYPSMLDMPLRTSREW